MPEQGQLTVTGSSKGLVSGDWSAPEEYGEVFPVELGGEHREQVVSGTWPRMTFDAW
jgi:hypothetical protein